MSKRRKTTSVQHIGNDQVVVTFHYGEWANDYADRYEHKYEVLFIKRTPVVVRRSRVGGDTEVFRLHYAKLLFNSDKVSKRIKKYLKKDYGAAILSDEGEINRMALLFNDRELTINEFSDGVEHTDFSELEWCWGKGEYVVRKLELETTCNEEWGGGEREYASSGISNTSPKQFIGEYSLYNDELIEMYGVAA